jgi:tRNA(adenine34) deaminase
VTSDPAAWELVSPQWRACLVEAWTSWSHGSLGVGAVIISPDGEVVARGRNREGEQHAPAGQLAGSYLAHAEVNALSALPRRRHPGHRLLVTLAPCLVCASAIVMTQLPQLTYAAADPVMDDVSSWLATLPWAASRLPDTDGPLSGPIGHFARLLPVLHMAEHRRQGRSFAVYQACQPGLVSQAEQLLADGTARQLRDLPCHLAFGALALPADA